MTEAASGTTLRVRLAWSWRLLQLGSPRRRRALILGCLSFAMVTLAVRVGLGSLDAWSGAGQGASLGGSVELVAFLRDDLPRSSRDALGSALGQLPGVERVRLLGSDEALEQMRRDLADRASVLDGVEEGFLPASLEIALRAGENGADRADVIAWRLRRMDGITDVDVRRSTSDERLVRLELAGRRSSRIGLALALATAVLALTLAAIALRRPRSDGRTLLGFGFTAAALAAPGAVAGAACAMAGVLIGTAVGALGSRLGLVSALVGTSLGGSQAGAVREASGASLASLDGPGARGLIIAGVWIALLGTVLGWWGSRPSARELDEIEALD